LISLVHPVGCHCCNGDEARLIFKEGWSSVFWEIHEEEGWLVLWRVLVFTIDYVPAQGIGRSGEGT
jgi:hypothetical protein